MSPEAQELEKITDKYAEKMPRTLGRLVRWVKKPELRWARLTIGSLFIVLGFVGFLPILGFWMVPLGLILLAQDIPFLQGPTLRAVSWLERKLKK